MDEADGKVGAFLYPRVIFSKINDPLPQIHQKINPPWSLYLVVDVADVRYGPLLYPPGNFFKNEWPHTPNFPKIDPPWSHYLVVDVADVRDDRNGMDPAEFVADDVEEPDRRIESVPDRTLRDLGQHEDHVAAERQELGAGKAWGRFGFSFKVENRSKTSLEMKRKKE